MSNTVAAKNSLLLQQVLLTTDIINDVGSANTVTTRPMSTAAPSILFHLMHNKKSAPGIITTNGPHKNYGYRLKKLNPYHASQMLENFHHH